MVKRQLVLDFLKLRQTFLRTNNFLFNNQMLKSEFFVLQILLNKNESKYLTVSDIAEKLNQSNPGVSRTIKGLGEKDWIERHSDPEDRRTTYICLSPEGREIYEEVLNEIVESTQASLEGFSEEDLEKFITVGFRLIDALQEK